MRTSRLARNCYHWPEFFEEHNIELPKLKGKAVLWGHCHHKATGGIEPEQQLLKDRMGLDVELAKGGCCGLAGSWGFEEGKYDISMQCGEVGWLPSVRKADDRTLIVADGFSCKTQLQQSDVGRQALHTAEVMKIAREHPDPGPLPERLKSAQPTPPLWLRAARTAAAVGVTAGLVVATRKALKKLYET